MLFGQPRMWSDVPDLYGRISKFCGPNDRISHGRTALTGQRCAEIKEKKYCAMRWDYGPNRKNGVKYWKKQTIKITAEKNGRSTICKPVDWGPHIKTGRIIDVSPLILQELKINTDDYVFIELQ